VRVFFDTNVLVSALATRGLCADVLRQALVEHEVVTGEIVIDEILHVLPTQLGLPKRMVDEVEQFLRSQEVVEVPEVLPDISIRDSADLKVLGTAMAAKADVLVTGDRDFLDIATEIPLRVLDPRGFWNLLRQRKRR
jgi:putative PIN family toxin of toxin-antitoxin system